MGAVMPWRQPRLSLEQQLSQEARDNDVDVYRAGETARVEGELVKILLERNVEVIQYAAEAEMRSIDRLQQQAGSSLPKQFVGAGYAALSNRMNTRLVERALR